MYWARRIKQRISDTWWRFKLRTGLLLALVSWALVDCGGQERQACYAQAELVMAAKAERLCPVEWDDCEHRQAILDELVESYRSCP